MIKYTSFTQTQFFSLSESTFSNFCSPLVDINTKLLIARITKCNFNNFLNPTISFSSYEHYLLKNEKYNHYHEYFSIGQLKIDTCSFKNCRSRGSSGGALFSICPTTIVNSYFYYCFADFGGAFCVFSDINVTCTNAYRCSAINGGSFSGKYGDLCTNSSSFSFCSSSVNGGAINYVESGRLNFNDLNCSYCTSDSHSSTLYLVGSFSSISNSVFSFCASLNGIGGICLYSHYLGLICKIDSSIFSKLKAKETSTSIYIDDMSHFSQSNFSISFCYFYKCSKKNVISSIHVPRVASSSLTGCIFSNNFETEIGKSLFTQNNNCFECISKFNARNIPKRKLFIAPHPYILSMDYVLEFVNAIKSSIIYSIYFSSVVLAVYEIIFVFKKVKIKKIK